MIKFHDKINKNQFALEIDKLDIVNTDFEVTEEMNKIFIQKRRGLTKKYKDFRKSQNTKLSWIRGKWKFMKGIKKFHRSTEGKRFHRDLGKFIVTHNFEGGLIASLKESNLLSNVIECLKALSSVRLHAYKELEYFDTVLNTVEYELFIEELNSMLNSIEKKLIKFDELNVDELEFLYRITDSKNVLWYISQKYNVPIKKIDEAFIKVKNKVKQELEFGKYNNKYYTTVYKEIINLISS